MGAFTSSQTGNWSSSSTWGGAGVPGAGDTASIGAHTVTVDVNTTVGTSPNNATTKAIDMTNAASVLIVAAGVTLTIKGNVGHVNASTHTQQAGSTVTFDNSGSGGTPVYTFINAGFSKFNLNGSSGNVATLQAIVGATFGLGIAMSLFTATFALLKRCSNLTWGVLSGNVTISDSTFDTCAAFTPSYTGTTANIILDRNTFVSGTGASDLVITTNANTTTGIRRIKQNNFAKLVTYAGRSFTITGNYLGGAFNSTTPVNWSSFRLNFLVTDGLLNGSNGLIFPSSFERNYFVVENNIGNPHYIAPYALGTNNTISQNIFESQSPDLIDMGDCMLLNASTQSGGAKLIAHNNIVLPSGGVSGNTSASGTLVTYFNSDASALGEWTRNTVNVNTSSFGGTGPRGGFAFAEGNTGTAGQVAVLKSNVAWGSAAGQGFLGERVTGNVKDIIVAAAADYNWTFNTSAGDNQRSYEDRVAANTLWTAGDAVAASVDVHQGTGDPQFYDSARNAAKWCSDRGYGAQTFAAAKTALQADLTRIPDLIRYVFEGFRSGNAACRNAAHDGGCVGAANYYKAARTVGTVSDHRAQLTKFGV